MYNIENFVILEAQKKNFDEMRMAFGAFLQKVIPLLTEKIPSCKDLKSLLSRSFWELRVDLEEATTIETVLKVVEEKSTIINVVMLKGIASSFEIREAQELISQYLEKMDKFCEKIKLSFVLNQLLSSSYGSFTCDKIEFVVDWDPDEYVLKDIRCLMEDAFQNLSNRVIVTKICSGSSIIVMCYAPQNLIKDLTSLARANLSFLIKERHLTCLQIGHLIVYDKNSRSEVSD